jgi:aldose sugar dehydrogenase
MDDNVIMYTVMIGFLAAALIIFLFAILSIIIIIITPLGNSAFAQNKITREREIPGTLFAREAGIPLIKDPKLKAELLFKGLEFPTSMTFIGPNDILVLEKAKGTVQRITNGQILSKPLLKVNVSSEVERGMLGIAVSKHENGTMYVFLYFTEAVTSTTTTTKTTKNNNNNIMPPSVTNRLYRYGLVDNKLINPKLLLDLPATPGPRHNGGAITIGPDNNVYVTIGDVDGHTTEAQNVVDGTTTTTTSLDGTGGILRITQDGKPAGNIIGNNNNNNSSPANKYFAYGIRNSYGIDFDPLTGKLWDTENGPGFDDEINLVEPGFNSGWLQVQGKAPIDFDYFQLVNFHGKGKYRDPEFSWTSTVGPTKIVFLNSDKLGKQYDNDIFVSDIHLGRIYHFKVNYNRTGLDLAGPLADKVADTPAETEVSIFGSNFAGISDLVVGPDGYLYVLSLGRGAIYKILPVNNQ